MKFKFDPYSLTGPWCFYLIRDPHGKILYYGVECLRELFYLSYPRASVKWYEFVPEGLQIELEILKICNTKKEANDLVYSTIMGLSLKGEFVPINHGFRVRGPKPVMRVQDGKRFESVGAAALACGMGSNNFSNAMRGRCKFIDGNRYVYCD